MARGKKNESALTPEEKLERALVPESERPYQVPTNWKWIGLGNLVEIRRGASPRPIKAYVTEDETGVNWIKIGDTDSGKYITQIAEKITSDGAKKSVFVEEGTLLLSNSMSFGRPYILKVNGCIHDGWLAITPSAAFNKEYLYYALLASEWYFEQVAVGTAVRNLNSERVAGTPIPCPPLSEQQRIVDRIESLFAKLDEAKEKAQTVLDSFETRKAAILHKAFTGELTAKWRAENNIGCDAWQLVLFDNCVVKMQNGLAKRAGSNGIPFTVLRLANLSDNGFITDDLRKIVLDEKEQENYRLMPNDVLMIRVNGSKDNVGKQLLVGKEKNWAFCDHIIRIRYSHDVLPAYMVLFSKSDAYRLYVKDNMVSSAGQNTISRKGMAHLSVPVPSISEQTEIVRTLDSLFAKEQQAKEAAEAVLEKIDLLKKSILARAFRGELGTNDPREESAVELLKGVL